MLRAPWITFHDKGAEAYMFTFRQAAAPNGGRNVHDRA
jgi:hypothetical protein